MVTQQNMLLDLVNEVKPLKDLAKEKDRKFGDLEQRVNDIAVRTGVRGLRHRDRQTRLVEV